MPLHVFIGAGPANLDRALKIANKDPGANFIFIDQRLDSTGNLERNSARANIFRLPQTEVDKLVEEGIDRQAFDKVSSYQQDKSRQLGDDIIFGDNTPYLIQIRDFQQLYLDAIKNKSSNTQFASFFTDLSVFQQGSDRGTILEALEDTINKLKTKQLDEKSALEELQTNDPQDMLAISKAEQALKSTMDRLQQAQAVLATLQDSEQSIHVHNAAGALTNDTSRVSHTDSSILYPERDQMDYGIVSPDLMTMTTQARHGTTTYSLNKSHLSAESINQNLRSLDDRNWKPILGMHGWKLDRPPRVRIFTADDTLYIGTEIPASFAKLDKEHYQQAMENYTRDIAKLVLPTMIDEVKQLPINKQGVNAPSQFITSRGETGSVIDISETKGITHINHGDRRYLPQYQTGSGFLTASKQNDIYANIYSCYDFESLYKWAKTEGLVTDSKSLKYVQAQYQKFAGPDETAQLQAFQADLYVAKTREVLNANKEKVNKYFTQLQNQSMITAAKSENFQKLVNDYKDSNSPSLSALRGKSTPAMDRPMVIMDMLKNGNEAFLRKALPRFINTDINQADAQQLFQLRDIFIDGLKKTNDVQLNDISSGVSHELHKITIQVLDSFDALKIDNPQYQDCYRVDSSTIHAPNKEKATTMMEEMASNNVPFYLGDKSKNYYVYSDGQGNFLAGTKEQVETFKQEHPTVNNKMGLELNPLPSFTPKPEPSRKSSHKK